MTTTPESSFEKQNDFYHPSPSHSGCWSDNWLPVFQLGRWCKGEDVEPIDPLFDCYHPYVCNACKRGEFTKTALKRCTACKIIKYCCREHQKRDWPRHKRFCSVLKECFHEKVEDISSWRKQSKEFFGRFDLNEAIVLSLQPRCRGCFSSGVEEGVRLKTCPRCHCVAKCLACLKDDSQTTDISDNDQDTQCLTFHPEGGIQECNTHILSLACTGMVVEQGSPLYIESNTDCESYFLPSDWSHYLKTKRSDFGPELPAIPMLHMAPVVSLLTDGLSLPLTIHYVLHIMDVEASQRKSLVLHFIGASSADEIGVTRFIEILRLIPSLTMLEVVLIGPDLAPVAFPTQGKPLNFAQPSTPIRSSCETILKRRVGFYDDISSTLDTEPDLIIASHAGIQQNNYYKWKKNMQFIAQQKENTPVLFTCINWQEAQNDLNALEMLGMRVEILPKANPFRGLRPFLDPVREDGDFFYRNAFFMVGRGAKSTDVNDID